MTNNPHMTAGEAIIWIATRDDLFAAKWKDASGLGIELALNFDSSKGQRVRRERSARQALERKCNGGRIIVSGWRGTRTKRTGVRREQVAAEVWADAHLKEVDDRMVLVPVNGGECWHDLLFRRVDVQRAFPVVETPAPPPTPAWDESKGPAKSAEPKAARRPRRDIEQRDGKIVTALTRTARLRARLLNPRPTSARGLARALLLAEPDLEKSLGKLDSMRDMFNDANERVNRLVAEGRIDPWWQQFLGRTG